MKSVSTSKCCATMACRYAVIFDRVPENLRARPTLSVPLTALARAREPGTLSYLTPGLGWRADYVALFDDSDGKIDVQGWVTLKNTSGMTYENAQDTPGRGIAQHRRDGSRPNFNRAPAAARRSPQPVTESGSRERLGDYYLYPLAERTTIADQQTKQVSFLDVHGVPASTATSSTTAGWDLGAPRSAQTRLRFSNSAHAGLGRPASRRRRCAFISATNTASRNSSARAASTTRPMGSMLSLDGRRVRRQGTTHCRASHPAR